MFNIIEMSGQNGQSCQALGILEQSKTQIIMCESGIIWFFELNVALVHINNNLL